MKYKIEGDIIKIEYKCTCPCHDKGNAMMHFRPCCNNGVVKEEIDVHKLEEHIRIYQRFSFNDNTKILTFLKALTNG